jgi:hypothetical protein
MAIQDPLENYNGLPASKFHFIICSYIPNSNLLTPIGCRDQREEGELAEHGAVCNLNDRKKKSDGTVLEKWTIAPSMVWKQFIGYGKEEVDVC